MQAKGTLLCLGIGGFLEVAGTILLLEALNAARSINILLLARIERMAARTDFRVDFLGCAARLKAVSATTSHGC